MQIFVDDNYINSVTLWLNKQKRVVPHINMTVWIVAENYISFTIEAGLIRLHMPGVKKSLV